MSNNGSEQYSANQEAPTIPVCWQSINAPEDIKNPGPLDIPESYDNRFYVPGKSGLLRRYVCDLIDSANEMLCISSYIIDDAEVERSIQKAIEHNIDVYILTSHFKFLEDDEGEWKVDEDMEDTASLKQHEILMNKLAGKAFLRSAVHIHSKFILADPQSNEGPRGCILTSNLRTKELCENTDIAIPIDGQAAKDVFYQFSMGFWNETQQELLEPGRLSHKTDNSNIVIPPLKNVNQVYYTTRSQQNLKTYLVNLINNSEGPIKISSYGYEISNDVLTAILGQIKNGRQVTVFARPRSRKPKTEAALIALAKAGAEVYGIMNLHAKLVIVGEPPNLRAVLMTANAERRGLDEGFETGIDLQEEKALLLNNITENWVKLAHFKLSMDVLETEVKHPYLIWNNHKLHPIQADP